MTTYQLLCLIGVPGALVALYGWMINMAKKQKAERAGIQALLRAKMIDEWEKWSTVGAVPLYARDSFENCYQRYHTLGANGVMTDLHDRFMRLPIK